MNSPIVLSIAGIDPSSGAGIYADIKTISTIGAYPMAVPTSLTNQTSTCFKDIKPTDESFFKDTLHTMFSSYDVRAVKIGIITEVFQVLGILENLKAYKPSIVVLDPIINSSTGHNFWNEEIFEVVKNELLNHVDIITPNHEEAKMLNNINKEEDRGTLVKSLYKQFMCKIAMTGGDTLNKEVEDMFYDGIELKKRSGKLIDIPKHMKHGTGCTFSSALTSYLALGADFHDACNMAAVFVEDALNNAIRYGKDSGAMDQLGRLR
jgi:hydroxymethylpyrimidine kinase/phosphomethylpyrimidine kinase